MPEHPLFFLWLFKHQRFSSPSLHNTVSKTTLGTILLTVQDLHELQDTISHHWSSGTSHPRPTYESRGFPEGWPVSLACASVHIIHLLSTKRNQLVGSIYVLSSVTEHYIFLPLVLNPLFNGFICSTLLILSTRPQKPLTSNDL